MNPLAILATMLGSSEFKIVTFLVVVVLIALVVLEFQKARLEIKVNKQQSRINDRILAGTL